MSGRTRLSLALPLLAALAGCPDDVSPPPAGPTCCAAGESCDPALPACEGTCGDAVCEPDQRCEEAPAGGFVGCTDACPAARQCGASACCAPGASCVGDACQAPNLVLEGGEVRVSAATVAEDDCQLAEGCYAAAGRRSRVHVDVSLKNAGDAPLALGAPDDGELHRASFCEGSWVIDHLLHATVRSPGGEALKEGWLPTRCLSDGSGGATCSSTGLEPGALSPAQPDAACDFVDVTGLAGGDYELVLEVNPDKAIAESSFDDNQLVVPFHYPACDGEMCGGSCCPAGAACEDDVCMVPDLRIDEEAVVSSITFQNIFVDPGACTVFEGCVNGTGARRVLSFTGKIENWGPGHLNPGAEPGNPLFELSECHGHYHFLDFTDYRVLNLDMSLAAQGHKQSFCLLNMVPTDPMNTDPPPPPPPGSLGCSFLAAGWADIYGAGTECQWVDVTDLPPGDYYLSLAVNPLGKVAELATENNTVVVPVTIPEPEVCVPEPEICGDFIDQDCDFIPDNGCCFDGAVEICANTMDDDCNGVVDDGCTPLTGTDTCATSPILPTGAAYLTTIDAATGSESSPSCGGAGGDVYFRFSLATDDIVYLDTYGSTLDTTLSLLQGGCGGTEVACSDDSCADTFGQLAVKLTAGDYAIAIKAKTAGDTGDVRVNFVRGGCADAVALEEPGIYSGDTSDSTDPASAGCGASGNRDLYFMTACPFDFPYLSTCGASSFDSTLHVQHSTCGGTTFGCSSDGFGCSDPDGATLQPFVGAPRLLFIGVEGTTAGEAGPYQLMASF